AGGPDGEQKIRIVHPFHPLRGQSFPFVVTKQLWGEQRVTVQFPDGSFHSLPTSWTDLAPPDPYWRVGRGRSRFRVEDLLQLAKRLRGRSGQPCWEERDVK
ncbi:Y4bD/Y4pK family protein, partial [Acidobacteria bacterium AH-259-G07]|nr:Y4bD/Y4pK family protein [Acidobacteria bacterium AH-259-G07]